jgi:hypothetical protein
MSFNPVGAASYPQIPIYQPGFDLQGMLKKAAAYAGSNEDLLEYINDILNDKTFQDNPRAYLNAWRERRCPTDQYKRPEDQARKFFDVNFKFWQILNFNE